jgi:GT2 family glycosyltransferase
MRPQTKPLAGLDDVGQGPPQVSVVIVAFNSGPLLIEAVAHLLESTVDVAVTVSDNASVDGSVQLVQQRWREDPRLSVVYHHRNLGFAKACNRVLARTNSPYVLFLNPDCLVQPDTLQRMLEVLAGFPEAGMAGCLIRNADGSEQAGCRRREPTPWRSLARVLHLRRLSPNDPRLADFNMTGSPLPAEPVVVDAISGAFMLVNRDALAIVGPLDEGYFLHCEDLDWCRRFRDHGFEVLFVPGVEVTHFKGVSSRGRPIRVEWHKHRGMLRYYSKHYRRTYSRPWMWLVHAGVWGRLQWWCWACHYAGCGHDAGAGERRNGHRGSIPVAASAG